MENDERKRKGGSGKTGKTGKNPKNQPERFDYLHPGECTDPDLKDELSETILEVQTKADKYIEEHKDRNTKASG